MILVALLTLQDLFVEKNICSSKLVAMGNDNFTKTLHLAPATMKTRYKIIALHAGAWLLFLLYEWIFKQGILKNPETSLFHLKIVAIRVLALLPAVYFTTDYLVPKLFFHSRKWFVFALLGVIVADTLLMKTLNYFLALRGVPGFAPTYLKSISDPTGWLIFMGNIAFNISFVLMIYFINKWLRDDRRRQALEAAKKEAELQLLKSQVQPHFLFNVINNIYALSKKNAPETTEMIYRLSGLLEYMLYDSSKEWIALDLELAYISNYLEIEKARYGTRLDVSFSSYGNIAGLEIPPLVLLPFVENSFKHGLSRSTGQCWLRIETAYDGEWLTVKVENSKAEDKAPAGKGGIGIQNVLKRLEILLPGRFTLKQLDDADCYLTILTLLPKTLPYERLRHKVEMPGC